MYGGIAAEAAIDDAHVTMLASSKINGGANFAGFSTTRLDSLSEGRGASGQTVVGESKRVVKRIYVDVFADCVRSVNGVEWKDIVVHVGRVTQPLILIATSFTFFIAPIIGQSVTLMGKYNPGSMFSETPGPVLKEKEVSVVVKIPCRYCGTLNNQLNAKCESCGAPLR